VIRQALLVLCVCLAGFEGVDVAAQQPTGEYAVKAAYLYNFGRFVEWPTRDAASDDTFRICILGRDPFGPTLDATLTGQMVRGRRVAASRILSPRDASACAILYISASEEPQIATVMAGLTGTTALTVSDIPGFAERGGMIQFVLDASRVRFAINLPPAEDAGLVVSSELLRVAQSVRRRSRPGSA